MFLFLFFAFGFVFATISMMVASLMFTMVGKNDDWLLWSAQCWQLLCNDGSSSSREIVVADVTVPVCGFSPFCVCKTCVCVCEYFRFGFALPL